MTKHFLFIVSVFVLSLKSTASAPDIINFTTKEYKSHSINYCFTQDSSGVMYIGNAYGLLEYDGQTWRKIGLSDGKSALSLDIDKNGRIYIGSSSEFGYLKKNASGLNEYVSLKSKLPKQDINEILDLICVDDQVYFRSLYTVYCYKNNEVIELTEHSKDQLIYYLGIYQEKIRASKQGVGILTFPLSKHSISNKGIKDVEIRDVLSFGRSQTLLLTSNQIISENNSSRFEEANKKLKNVEISCALTLNEHEFLIGTVNKGLFHLNTEGEIISNFNMNTGLQDNFIHDLFLDNSGNIWLAYNNGVGLLKWKSPVRYIPPSMGIEGMGYCALVKGDTLFAGTSNGLYYLPNWEISLKKQQKFTPITGINGIINDLKLHKGKLIACQAAEVYQIEAGSAVRISNGSWFGSWTWKKHHQNENKAYVGTYVGISNYEWKNKTWKFTNHVKGFSESSRMFEVDKRGVFWIVQGNKGLYRLMLNQSRDSAVSVVNYTDIMNVSSQDHFNDIFSYHDSIFVSSYGHTYYIKEDSLVPLASFENLGAKSHRIRKHKQDGLYAIYDDQAHILNNSTGVWEVQNSPVSFLKSYLVGSAEFFYEVSENTYFIGTQDGFATYTPKNIGTTSETPCLIRGIELLNPHGDSLIFNSKPVGIQEFLYENNNIRISYTIPLYGNNKQISYETRLFKNGKAMHQWQQVQEVNFKEYTNLKEATYTFKVRAKKGDEVAGSTAFKFIISPPWYRTTFMNLIYFLLFVAGIYLVINLFQKQKKKLELENKKEIEIKEKLHKAETIALELKSKENELAYLALTFTQKKDLLSSLTSQLDKISKELSHSDQIKFRSVKTAISNNLDNESNWENFQVHFDEKNDNFFQKIKQKEKRMNESYLLFCSYVRMGKSNKEIAELLNISVAAVEKRKYRLKKKWDLPDDTSFTEYLRNL
ncbi:MAG: ligand-binding sensor domain-containing protein [Saprospiraceae bacterium]|jgi:ligand-binding sensor domain-containing protein